MSKVEHTLPVNVEPSVEITRAWRLVLYFKVTRASFENVICTDTLFSAISHIATVWDKSNISIHTTTIKKIDA